MKTLNHLIRWKNRLMCYIGSELWESKFDGLLSSVKEYIIDVWEIRKHKLYDSDSGPGQQLHSRSSPGGMVSSEW